MYHLFYISLMTLKPAAQAKIDTHNNNISGTDSLKFSIVNNGFTQRTFVFCLISRHQTETCFATMNRICLQTGSFSCICYASVFAI
mmetsp:Transcript_32144/g.85757  ORF Transcript_32144/g.85757 Transcript_32144/m.85757 type:complete len:86 (-) Transcript_32144:185-442(-)